MSRNYTVKLRPGITHANLPDKRKMLPGTTYQINESLFAQISTVALKNSVIVTAVSEGAVARRAGIDLTLNSTTIPAGFKIGQTELGLGENDRFMLVKVVDAVAVTAGMALCWANKATRTVTPQRVGGSALAPLEFAGIAPNAITAGRYGWMQTDGVSPVPASVGAAGDNLEVHPTVDGTLRGAVSAEVYTIATSATGGTLTLTVLGQTTAPIAFNATAATVQTAIAGLSSVGAGNVAVSGTDLTGAGLTITFQGIFLDSNIVDVTRTSSVTGGAATATLTKVSDGANRLGIGVSLGTLGVNIRGKRRHPHRHILRRFIK